MMRKITFMIAGMALAVLAGCSSGPQNREAMSEVDSPDIHYERGKSLLQQENFEDAKFEFDQAISLDAKYAPAYEGLAWYHLEKNNLDAATESVDKALDLDGKWVLAKFARANIKARQEKYDDAIDEAKDAIKDVSGSSVPDKSAATIEGTLVLGDIYRVAGHYTEAQSTYQTVLEIDNTNMHADKAIKDLAAYQAAVAGQRPELRKIASKKAITRSDVAVLFVLELPLQKIFREAPRQAAPGWRPPGESTMGKRESAPEGEAGLPADVPSDHWAKSFIKEAVEKGALELMPDAGFHPDQEVDRAEFARLIEKFIVRYWNDNSLETKFFGNTSPFYDVNSTTPVFNAIMTVSTRNWMPGYDDGSFKPTSVVNGTAALNVIRKLKADL